MVKSSDHLEETGHRGHHIRCLCFCAVNLDFVDRDRPAEEKTLCQIKAQAVAYFSLFKAFNTLCDTALVYGFADQKSVIDNAVVGKVLKDKQAAVAQSPDSLDQQSSQTSGHLT